MSGTLQDLIPGLREAEERYRSEAQEAFADAEPRIAGAVEILPMTPQMFIDLEGAECGFVVQLERGIDERDLAIFLWRCSPYYQRGNDELRRFFIGSLAPMSFRLLEEGVWEYLRRTLSGMPLWKSKPGASRGVAAWPSRLVHLFATNYGWTEKETLNCPLRRLWQYANRILEEKDPNYTEHAPAALELRARYLQTLAVEAQRN